MSNCYTWNNLLVYLLIIYSFSQGRVDDLSFFEYLSQFCFLSIEFYCTYYISYKILPYFVYYYCILIRMRQAVGTSFFRARFAFFHTHACLLISFAYFFILFHSCCSHAQVFGKTLVHEFPISYSHTEWYLLFSLCEGNE